MKKIKDLNLPEKLLPLIFTNEIYAFINKIQQCASEWLKDVHSFNNEFIKIKSYGDLDEKVFLETSAEHLAIGKLHLKFEKLIKCIPLLPKWADFSRICHLASTKGLKILVDEVSRGTVPSNSIQKTYLLGLYESMAKTLIKNNPMLESFSRVQHEEKRSTFQILDKKILELFQEEIGFNASRVPPPSGISRGPIKSWTEMALINREIGKTMRHIPIRRLLERSGEAIRALKPCFMMSPMSVAQYLEPGKHEFDVVIMDEASQVKPHEAFGAIARGKQVIIVGDPKQLPPTTFFDVMADGVDTEEETSADDTESILDLCMSVNVQKKRLKWHYRSEHETLIAFSNSRWYDNDLIIFPSPDASRTELGVKFHYIENAEYASSRNVREAEFVAQAIVDHAQRFPTLTLGVGTFNIHQRDLIEDILERLRKENTSVDHALSGLYTAKNESDRLFIKNLENLQGDERDVIFISCTYGPDKETKAIFQRFGPVNGKNGPRRLNVMFTRAKKRMEIFSSMLPEDIKGGPSTSPGALALKQFLTYAQTGELHEEGIATGNEADSDFELSVAKILKQYGYTVQPQVGVSGYRIDIGVFHPDRDGEYLLGIECDGATYHSSQYARDRDRLREEVLKRRGWNLHRIWSTDWFKNRNTEIERMIEVLKTYREKDTHKVKLVPRTLTQPIYREKKSDKDVDFLRRKLIKFRLENIPLRDDSPKNGILRNEMILELIKNKPTNIIDFQNKIPRELQNSIHLDEKEYLDDIFAILEELND